MHTELLLTGSELMSGDTVDSNSATIARALAENGQAIQRKVTLGDDLQQLVSEIRAQSVRSELLLINGGLGPTVDDLTARALAEAAGVHLEEHPQALKHLERCCEQIGMQLNAANRKQALLPAGCRIIPNARGTAVGFALEFNDCQILCTPGVPSELAEMLRAEIVPWLRQAFGATLPRRERLFLFGIGESTAQQQISEHFGDWPESIELGFRAGFPVLEVKLTASEQCDPALLENWAEKLRLLFADHVLSTDHLGQAAVDALAARGARVTTAESCTGGAIAAAITEVAGASGVFDAGFVSYSNSMKQELLGVSVATIESSGAVSEQTVREMAAGALERSGADYALAVSGIAGPTGGSDDRPVGTLWIAWGTPGRLRAERLQLPPQRARFQKFATALALDLLRRAVLEIDSEPDWLQRWRSRDQ